MELRHLRYFAILGEEENFARASQRLAITQPALSRQIMDLERELGFVLLDRLPRGVRLSEAGRSFLGDAKRILGEVSRMAERARSIDRGEVGNLRVGFNESASSNGPMSRALNAFRSARPNVSLDLRPISSVEQLDALAKGDLDAGFVYHFDGGIAGTESLLVEVHETVMALPSSHPLAARNEVRLEDVAGEPMVWIRRAIAPQTYDRQMQACLEHGFSPTIMQEAVTESMMLSLVATGVFVGLVTSAKYDCCPTTVCLRPISNLSLAFRLHFVWRRDCPSAVLSRFVETVTEVVTRGSPP